MAKIDMTGWKMSEHGVPDSVLTVLYQTDKQAKDGQFIWHCRCECGKIFTIEGKYLTRSKEPYRSCGCNNKSIGENNIEQILQENNITYIRDKIYFKDLLKFCRKYYAL